MNASVAIQRKQAHQLLDSLSDEKLGAVYNLLELLTEPLSVSLAKAPVEEEELSEGTLEAIERSRVSMARGEFVSHEEVLREFGL